VRGCVRQARDGWVEDFQMFFRLDISKQGEARQGEACTAAHCTKADAGWL
jgi:hypothetical protein